MANDCGLINACFSFSHFKPWVNETKAVFSFPAFRLLRVGCGTEEEYKQTDLGRPLDLQGMLPTALSVVDMFMSSNSDRTDLLCNVSS